MQMPVLKCPDCKAVFSEGAPPAHTPLSLPTAPGWNVVAVHCPFNNCNHSFGVYTYPAQ